MRIGVVWKLFLLTTALCMLILGTVYVGLTFFFEQYYANRKLNDVESNIVQFEKGYLDNGGNLSSIQKLEQEFYQANNTLITTLDSHGNLQSAADFYMDVKVPPSNKELSATVIRIPLYNLVETEKAADPTSPIKPGADVLILSLKNNGAYVPIRIKSTKYDTYWGNEQIVNHFDDDASIKFRHADGTLMTQGGQVVAIEPSDVRSISNFAYSNPWFMEKIKEFQAKLLLGEGDPVTDSMQTMELTQNNVKYKLFIHPFQSSDGSTVYVFALASLQPVNEAVLMLKDYYGYLVGLAMLLIVLVSFYYSKKIAKPLLKINSTTKKIANLDFSEQLRISSKDEIGDLSHSINRLSSTLHSYIDQLQKDIEKEKQLENTRKEFISGVSHELKTPLSIMKSCISIMKDGVAEHKREHYFEAMEKEVDKMDLLIVDMLELAMYESGTYKIQMDVFDIDKVIEQLCEQLSLPTRQKQLHIELQLAAGEVVANQLRMEQVLTNFMTNAILYTPEQGRISIATIAEGEFVKVSIENKGAHIPESQLDKVWDRFYRGDTSRQRAQGGTGLGLAISKNILELHGVPYGAVNTDDGVLFYFYLHSRI